LNYKNIVRKLLLGTGLPQEYLCIKESLEAPLSVFLTGKSTAYQKEVSRSHLFLGYRPLVMAVVFDKSSDDAKWADQQDQVCLSFIQGALTINSNWKGFGTDQRAVANLALEKIKTFELGDSRVFVLQGEAGAHKFLSVFHQVANQLKEKLMKKLPGNIDLPGNLYDQVITAYAIPRSISVITVLDGSKMNLFPTDLHGPAGSYYLSSLRIGGKANEQIERTGTIAMSRVDPIAFRLVYEAGKNHMADPTSPDNFKLAKVRSKVGGIPLPEAVLSYKELEQTGSFDVGIHRIHYYEVVASEVLTAGPGLAHVHRYYAQWRLNQHLHTEIFFR
jgi:flavin reductase (DIM6/NTAB) family NADH-FMN oxidoreductase RutF